MAIANFDEIIRRILGMNRPPPDDAQPFVQDAPPGYEEDEMLPRKEGQSLLHPQYLQQVPYGQGAIQDWKFTAPMIIPNAEARDPKRPMQRGNAKDGSGIDI
jgi:hypothetical protein